MLACHSCWLRLPAPYRGVLDRTYRFRATLPGNWHRALRKCLEWYRDNPLEVPSGQDDHPRPDHGNGPDN